MASLIALFFSFLTFSFETFAQTAPVAAAQPQTPPAWMQFVPFLVIIVVFYFFIIRPQANKQKQQQDFLGSLKVGDQVITQSGLFGKITGINDHICNLEIAQGVQIKTLRSQITMLQSALQSNDKAST